MRVYMCMYVYIERRYIVDFVLGDIRVECDEY